MTPERRQEIERVAYGNTVAEGMVRELLAEVDRLAPFESAIRTMASDIDPDWCINADEPIDPTEVMREYRDMWIGIAKGG